MFDLILDSVEDFHTVEDRRLHRIFGGLENLVAWYDRLDANRQRKERAVLRGLRHDDPRTAAFDAAGHGSLRRQCADLPYCFTG